MVRSRERKQFLFDIFVTALEGSIKYWAAAKTYKWKKEGSDDEDLDNFHAVVVDAEDEDAFPESTINQDTIVKGVNRILKGGFQIRDDIRESVKSGNEDNDACYIDADAADCIVQAGLFNDIVFG